MEWCLTGQSQDSQFTANAVGVVLSQLAFASNEEYATYFGHFRQMDLNRTGVGARHSLRGWSAT